MNKFLSEQTKCFIRSRDLYDTLNMKWKTLVILFHVQIIYLILTSTVTYQNLYFLMNDNRLDNDVIHQYEKSGWHFYMKSSEEAKNYSANILK